MDSRLVRVTWICNRLWYQLTDRLGDQRGGEWLGANKNSPKKDGPKINSKSENTWWRCNRQGHIVTTDIETLGAILGSTSGSNQRTKAHNQSCELEADCLQGWGVLSARRGRTVHEDGANRLKYQPEPPVAPHVKRTVRRFTSDRPTPADRPWLATRTQDPSGLNHELRKTSDKLDELGTSRTVCGNLVDGPPGANQHRKQPRGRKGKSKTRSNDLQKSWNLNHDSTTIQRSFSQKISTKRSTLHHQKNDLG
jgi:hypothetical protein